MQGDAEYARQLAALRWEQAPELSRRVDEIAQATADGDGAHAVAVAHGLAGAAHVLGLPDLGHAAMAVVRAGKDAPEGLPDAVDELRQALAAGAPSGSGASAVLRRLNHDLRGPLTAVLGYASLVLQTDLDPDVRTMVESIQEAGTAMVRRLDGAAAEPEASEAATVGESSIQASAAEQSFDVLFVDDDALVRDLIRATLGTMQGVSATAAATVEEAESTLEQRHPDMILVDLDLAGADGAVVVAAARRRCPSAFVAVFTGDDPATRRLELQALGADAVVRKGPPDTIRVLIAAGRAKLELASLAAPDTP
jgi:CheY-like chemotaxis protein/HPt (histidine-containing phosphotransfer) domain-containing protein